MPVPVTCSSSTILSVLSSSSPGTYILWHDYRTTFEGSVYNKAESLPDQARIVLEHEGQEVPIQGSWGSGSKSGTHEKTEVGRYEIDTPGNYTLSVAGFSGNRVFSFGRSELDRVLFAAVACLLLTLLGLFGAIAVVIIFFVKRARLRNGLANRSRRADAVSADLPS